MSEIVRGNKCRDELVQQIIDAGQELIDRAEDMVSKNTDAITGFTIHIHFPQGDVINLPEISWDTEVVCNNTLRRWRIE